MTFNPHLQKYVHEKADYTILCDEFIKDEILSIYPENVLSSYLKRRWRTYQCKNIGISININENVLYNWCVERKLLAFSYALIEAPDRTLYSIFKVLDVPSTPTLTELLAHVYQYVTPVDDTLFDYPLNIFVPRRLQLNVTKIGLCGSCSERLYDGVCLNMTCQEVRAPVLSHINNHGPVVVEMKEVASNIDLSSNAAVLTGLPLFNTQEGLVVCKKCSACTLCKSTHKCKRHLVCRHTNGRTVKKNFKKIKF